MDYSTIAYAKINLDYDQNKFANEYDQYILPNARPVSNSLTSIKQTTELNAIWNMVPTNIYNTIVGFVFVDEFKSVFTKAPVKTWQMEQLMYIDAEQLDKKTQEATNFGYSGNPVLRNFNYHKDGWHLKPQYKDLEIVKFIQSLPFEKIVSIHCVSLEPGQFASIHRDAKGTRTESADNNKLAKDGYVVLCLNISSGGVPLYWALDGESKHTPLKVNDPAYISSDYFLHGVPQVTDRRRQIRITGIPSKDFANLVSTTDLVTISSNYIFDTDF